MSARVMHEVPAPQLIAAVLQSDNVLAQVQREVVRLLPGISIDQLREILRAELLRPEALNGEQAEQAHKLLDRMAQLRSRGLSMTQTLKAVTSPTGTGEDEEEDAYNVMIEDKWKSTGSG